MDKTYVSVDFRMVLLVLNWIHSGISESFNCYSCSYVLTSDPKANYECVAEPWNFTGGLVIQPCDSTRYCVTKTLYEKGYSRIRSLVRSCGRPESYTCGINCCQSSFYNEACQHVCQGELCNNNTTVIQKTVTVKKTPGSGPGTAASFGVNRLLIAALLLILLSLK